MTDSPTESQQMFRTLMRAFLQHLPRSAWRDIRRLGDSRLGRRGLVPD